LESKLENERHISQRKFVSALNASVFDISENRHACQLPKFEPVSDIPSTIA
jgi:hypothetical protein